MKNNYKNSKSSSGWKSLPRWKNIKRNYSEKNVSKLRGNIHIEYSIAKQGADRLWKLLHKDEPVRTLSALTGNQAVQQVKAGLNAIYVSGWQVAADMNNSLSMYPDQSLYTCDSVPSLVKRINNALIRADQIHHLNGDNDTHWLVPLVADAEAGFGGVLNAYEIMKNMIECGASGVHFEDQLASAKKCGHLGGKVLEPVKEFICKLTAARLAADVCGVDTILIARTDAESGSLLTSDTDPRDRPFIKGKKTSEGYFQVKAGLDYAIARGLCYAPYADLLWFETSHPDLDQAKEFAKSIHRKFPGKFLAYNCSPSFNWKYNLDENQIEKFQDELADLGYKFQFVTLSGFHSLNYDMFMLAKGYKEHGMLAYSKLQTSEFEAEKYGYEAIKHQSFVGTGYFDEITHLVSDGSASTLSMKESTEKKQFSKSNKR